MVQIKLRAQMSAQMFKVKKLAMPVALFKEAGEERRERQEQGQGDPEEGGDNEGPRPKGDEVKLLAPAKASNSTNTNTRTQQQSEFDQEFFQNLSRLCSPDISRTPVAQKTKLG